MTTYHVYTHDRLGEEAIADGFSWPGFSIGGLWLVTRHLWKFGLLVLAAEFGLIGALFAATRDDAPTWLIASLPAFVLLRGLIGLRSGDWREDSMGRRGFTFLATVQADSAEMATTRALRGARSMTGAGGEDGGSSGSRAPAAGGAATSAASPGTISEIDFERLGIASGGAEVRGRSRPSDDGAPRGGWRIDRRVGFAMAAVAVAAGALVLTLVAARREPPRAEDAESSPGDPGLVQSSPSPGSPAVVHAPAPQGVASAATASVQPADAPSAAPAPAPATGPVSLSRSPVDAGGTGSIPAPGEPSREDAQPADRSPAAMERAWLRHYRAPAACTNPTDWDVYVECVNNRLRAREAFERQWSGSEASGEGTPDD